MADGENTARFLMQTGSSADMSQPSQIRLAMGICRDDLMARAITYAPNTKITGDLAHCFRTIAIVARARDAHVMRRPGALWPGERL